MAQTKEEIESSIRELQYQYEALIAEGSYKLADQRLKRIKELKEQLKHMNDSMEILRLSGFQVNDACTKDYNFEDPKVIEAVIKKLEKEAKEGKFVDPNYLAGVKRALEKAKKERAKDACEKVFTKGEAEDDSPKEELIKYAEKTKDPEYIAHVKGLKNPNTINARLQAHRQGKDGDIILPQHKCSDSIESEIARVKQKIEGLYDKADEALKAKDKNKYNIIMSQIKQEERTLADLVRSTIHDDDATENGSVEEFGKNKEIEKMSPEKDPTLAQDASYPVVHREGDFKIVESDEGFELYFRGVYYDTYHTKEQALKFIEKYKERAKARGAKDSDPKVAEANAIINLCGGVM